MRPHTLTEPDTHTHISGTSECSPHQHSDALLPLFQLRLQSAILKKKNSLLYYKRAQKPRKRPIIYPNAYKLNTEHETASTYRARHENSTNVRASARARPAGKIACTLSIRTYGTAFPRNVYDRTQQQNRTDRKQVFPTQQKRARALAAPRCGDDDDDDSVDDVLSTTCARATTTSSSPAGFVLLLLLLKLQTPNGAGGNAVELGVTSGFLCTSSINAFEVFCIFFYCSCVQLVAAV